MSNAALPAPSFLPAWFVRLRRTRAATAIGAALVLVVGIGIVFAPLLTAADPLALGTDRLAD
ncbi:MAG TPA: hypothetical protein VMI56_18545, partial [Reyranella sp.]|nr:hypothetical protein [Reyranella sp.]